MTYLIFTIITGCIGMIGALSFAKYNKWPFGRVILPPLALVLFLAGLFEYFASFNESVALKSNWVRVSFTLNFIAAFLLLELIVSFMGKEGIRSPIIINQKPIKLRYIWRPVFAVTPLIIMFFPWFTTSMLGDKIIIQITWLGQLLFALLFCYHLLSLYIIEKLFRSIPTMQKRIFMLYLASAGIISIGSMVVIVRILFYQAIYFEVTQLHAALCAIFFPGILLGLARYQLWREQLSIGRGIVYTSFTILFFGIFLFALGIVATIVRLSGIEFDEFEEFVMLFCFLFIGVLTIFSPQMRKSITALTRKYIYKSKYDYRDQLLRLHSAHQASGTIQQTIKAFLDNLQYTIIVKQAFVFIRSHNENSFSPVGHLAASAGSMVLKGNSPLLKIFESEDLPALSIFQQNADIIQNAIESERALIDEMHISHLFAIKNDQTLLGILCIQAGNHYFDSEDLLIITMFCESIGTALYRDKILSEFIQQKQFESFNHMSSFFAHDIKNQVATLSLLTKNAHSNIHDADFHPVLLRSLENCSTNLSALIEKIQKPPQKDQLQLLPTDCNTTVSTVIEQTIPTLPPGIIIKQNLSPLPKVTIDASALYFVIKNLIINSIEAIKLDGTITCSSGELSAIISDDTYHFGLTPSDRDTYVLYIMVEDNGPGMSQEFLDHSLFKPFNTTKDKGIGIGLYQCKTLIESMGGRVLCWSREGKGSRFCILL